MNSNSIMITSVKEPRVVSANEGTVFHILGHEVKVKLHSTEANNRYVFELITPPGAGVPPHRHEREDEIIYILEGQFDVMVGGENFKAVTGDTLNFLRGIEHGYINSGISDAKTLWYVTPGDNFEAFFNELKLFPPGPPDVEKLNHLHNEYHITLLL